MKFKPRSRVVGNGGTRADVVARPHLTSKRGAKALTGLALEWVLRVDVQRGIVDQLGAQALRHWRRHRGVVGARTLRQFGQVAEKSR